MKAPYRLPLTPLPLAAAARGAVALAVPLLAGVVTGQVALAVLAGIGALWGSARTVTTPTGSGCCGWAARAAAPPSACSPGSSRCAPGVRAR
ncbi:hypothetical protein CF54_13565 [Streptomyces sp. Tu 6176]|uniref:hypothetical protein n=1 Tax=Streptomyces sp. Tu 6176 TaxID=1470557 RepID=UPI0004537C3D|nr:hypothetical protein [Streptomyces sp. Tu 6176]EYT82395.1 hypothetical protein CF54_13565 [Streptomyces sp. Tu 6176]